MSAMMWLFSRRLLCLPPRCLDEAVRRGIVAWSADGGRGAEEEGAEEGAMGAVACAAFADVSHSTSMTNTRGRHTTDVESNSTFTCAVVA